VWDVDVTELVDVAEIEVGVPNVIVKAALRVPPPVNPLPAVAAVAFAALVLSCVCTFDVTPSTKFNSAAVEVTPRLVRVISETCASSSVINPFISVANAACHATNDDAIAGNVDGDPMLGGDGAGVRGVNVIS
tara:strand:- start:3691 stop:4089 length:399 start_codon:yes stop_codon:yes gene_type:complete